MTLNQITDLLDANKLAGVLAELRAEELLIARCETTERYRKLRRIAIHINDDGTAGISFHHSLFDVRAPTPDHA